MQFLDKQTDTIWMLRDIHRFYTLIHSDCAELLPPTFKRTIYTLMLDSLNGRNNYKVIGLTRSEIVRFVDALADTLKD